MAPRPVSAVEYRVLARFRHGLRIFLRFSEDAVRAAGLTPAQHQLLLAVKGHDGPGSPSASEVAEALQLRVHSAVELINRAEQAGLVSRQVDPRDRRRHLLSLTTRGEDRLAALSRLHRHELRRFAEMVDEVRALDAAPKEPGRPRDRA